MRRTWSGMLLSPLLPIATLAGCADAAPPAATAPSPSNSPSWLSLTGRQPTLAATSSPPPSRSPSSPPPCEPDESWTAQEQTTWLRGVARVALVTSITQEAGVTLYPDSRLCRPVPVQAEYFVLTWSGTYVKATSVSRTTIQADGSGASVPLPPRVTDRDACTGAVVVVYTGSPPLADDDLPLRFDRNLGDKGWGARVAAHAYLAPRRASPDCPSTG